MGVGQSVKNSYQVPEYAVVAYIFDDSDCGEKV